MLQLEILSPISIWKILFLISKAKHQVKFHFQNQIKTYKKKQLVNQ
jgi:hypothetical protein